MVRIVKAPSFARNVFTDNELSGHMDGIEYTPREKKLRKRYRASNNIGLPVNEEPPKPLQTGKKVN